MWCAPGPQGLAPLEMRLPGLSRPPPRQPPRVECALPPGADGPHGCHREACPCVGPCGPSHQGAGRSPPR
eukprot:2010328-Pyramimonas_sp.AAC.1